MRRKVVFFADSGINANTVPKPLFRHAPRRIWRSPHTTRLVDGGAGSDSLVAVVWRHHHVRRLVNVRGYLAAALGNEPVEGGALFASVSTVVNALCFEGTSFVL